MAESAASQEAPQAVPESFSEPDRALDEDAVLERVTAAILRVRTKGLGKQVWARRVAAVAYALITEAEPP